MRLDGEKLKKKSGFLSSSLKKIRVCEDAAELRGLEGEAASVYFSVFDDLILQQKEDFFFHGRSKRPPTDKVNAMLSFAYTLLTGMCAGALETVGLDPYAGFFHTDRDVYKRQPLPHVIRHIAQFQSTYKGGIHICLLYTSW